MLTSPCFLLPTSLTKLKSYYPTSTDSSLPLSSPASTFLLPTLYTTSRTLFLHLSFLAYKMDSNMTAKVLFILAGG